MTRVVNIRHERYDVYIGRGTPFGNPFVIGADGSREGVISEFRNYFYNRMLYDKEFRSKVDTLEGKVLGCHCKPLDCHGDVYVAYFDLVRGLR